MVTPRRLEFGGTKPIVKFPCEGNQRIPEPVQENHMVIHPNASGYLLGDRPQGEDNLRNDRGIMAGSQDRLEVGLTPEDLKKLYDDLERDSTIRARPLRGKGTFAWLSGRKILREKSWEDLSSVWRFSKSGI